MGVALHRGGLIKQIWGHVGVSHLAWAGAVGEVRVAWCGGSYGMLGGYFVVCFLSFGTSSFARGFSYEDVSLARRCKQTKRDPEEHEATYHTTTIYNVLGYRMRVNVKAWW